MNKFFTLRPSRALFLFAGLDVIAFGMGMGVPIFCILLGLPVGWYIAKFVLISTVELRDSLRRIFKYVFVTSLVTFVLMGIAWGRTVPLLFNPGSDLANFGIPMILFDPKPSFAGWLVLMIFISPFLQFLTTLFGSYVTILDWLRRDGRRS